MVQVGAASSTTAGASTEAAKVPRASSSPEGSARGTHERVTMSEPEGPSPTSSTVDQVLAWASSSVLVRSTPPSALKSLESSNQL